MAIYGINSDQFPTIIIIWIFQVVPTQTNVNNGKSTKQVDVGVSTLTPKSPGSIDKGIAWYKKIDSRCRYRKRPNISIS